MYQFVMKVLSGSTMSLEHQVIAFGMTAFYKDYLMNEINAISTKIIDSFEPKSTSGSILSGIMSVPEDMYYLAYGFLDTEHRSENANDYYRLATFIKEGDIDSAIVNLVEAIARDFIERLPEDKKDALLNSIYAKTGARFATTTTLMYLLTSQMNSSIARYPKLKASLRILRGAAINSILTIGALAHRSAYDSRELREKNPRLYWRLRSMGDLDILYFLIKDHVSGYVDASSIQEQGRDEDYRRVIDNVINQLNS